MKRAFLKVLLATVLLVPMIGAAVANPAEDGAREFISNFGDRTLAAVRSTGLSKLQRKVAIGEILIEGIDFASLARFALGGLMGGQFMTSSLVAENRTLCLPASVQSIPSTADFQDVVSFGLIAGRKAKSVITNTNYVLAFELLCAAQAADIRGAQQLSPATSALYAAVRETLPYLDYDTVLTDHLETLAKRIASGEMLQRVESVAGKLLLTDESNGRAEPPQLKAA